LLPYRHSDDALIVSAETEVQAGLGTARFEKCSPSITATFLTASGTLRGIRFDDEATLVIATLAGHFFTFR